LTSGVWMRARSDASRPPKDFPPRCAAACACPDRRRRAAARLRERRYTFCACRRVWRRRSPRSACAPRDRGRGSLRRSGISQPRHDPAHKGHAAAPSRHSAHHDQGLSRSSITAPTRTSISRSLPATRSLLRTERPYPHSAITASWRRAASWRRTSR